MIFSVKCLVEVGIEADSESEAYEKAGRKIEFGTDVGILEYLEIEKVGE